MADDAVQLRRAVRAVMLTPDRRVLLMRVQEPLSGRTFWITPGGGIEEIQASPELFAPRKLGEWMAQLVQGGAPGEPIDVGV